MITRPDLDAARELVAHPPITRFAPSPTGYLHLGHVANAIYVWGMAAALGGRVLLRVEDHDRIRCRTDYETALLDDLDWLGFTPSAGRDPVARQSDRQVAYARAFDVLHRADRLYACGCSRRDIGGERYPNRCRDRGLPFAQGFGIRVRVDRGAEEFDDLLLGRQAQTPADQCGDVLLKDRDGHWTYQFAVTVDDTEDGVTLVVRGQDLLESTGRQRRLARMLGGTAAPIYLHHPLIASAAGVKLSKSAGDTGVRELRRAGTSAAEVIGRAAAAVGLLQTPRPILAGEVAALFMPR